MVRRRRNTAGSNFVETDFIGEMIAAPLVESRAFPPGWDGRVANDCV
jgi:hypothetical protein